MHMNQHVHIFRMVIPSRYTNHLPVVINLLPESAPNQTLKE